MLNNNIYIREMKASDLPQLKLIIDDSQMFSSKYLDDMTTEYLSENSEEQWFVLQGDAQVIGLAYCAPEKLTFGTWNLLLISVLTPFQGRGLGTKLVKFVEAYLTNISARLLLIETSGLPEFELARAFYPKRGYKQVALIPDYYDVGDDKLVFIKCLSA